MVAPVNLDFSQQGPSPGTALGWTVTVQSAGVLVADFRGTQHAPSSYEDFDHDWGNDQAWSDVIAVAAPAMFDRPQKPVGVAHEDFNFNWLNDPSLGATGFCNVYLFIVDPALAATFCGSGANPRGGEDFDVGWGSSPPVVSSTATNPSTVTLSVPHGVQVGQRFPVYVLGHLTNTALNGLWAGALAATATSSTQLTIPVLGSGAGGATGVIVFESSFGMPGAPPYASTVGLFDGGAHAYEDFTPGWDDAAYYLTTPAATAASYRGWAANAPSPPSVVASAGRVAEDFYQLVGALVPVAIVDTSLSLVSLAPGYHLTDGARVVFTASAPFTNFGSSYPSPIVPGVGYVTWNASPALGMDRLHVGIASAAAPVGIVSSTNANPIAVTTSAPHGLSPGHLVFVYGHLVNTSLNGFQTVAATPTSTTFTVAVAGVGVGAATGTAYGPVTPVAFATVGGAQLALAGDPAWDWPNP